MADQAEAWPDDPVDAPAEQWPDDPVDKPATPNTDSPFPQPVMDKANQFAMSPAKFDMAKYGSGMQDIATAFGRGFHETVGPERLGLSDESQTWLNKHGVFTHFEDEKTNPFSAFGALFGAAASVLDGANRAVQGVYRGAQDAGVAMGLPKDVVSMPDAFMGSPHPTGIPKPYVKPTAIEPIKVGDTPSPIAKPRTELAQTGIPHVDAILNSEPGKTVINEPVIDRSHTVPNSWSGSDPPENPTVYISKDFPKELEVDGIKWDPAESAAVRENAEEIAYDALVEGGMAPDVAQKVAYHDVGNPVENAWYSSHGIDWDKANAVMQPILDRIDQARDVSDVPPDMFTGMYTKGDPAEALPGPFDKPTEAESQQGREILERKFLSGRVATVQEVLNTARDLDVIGPPKPEPTFEGSPTEQAEQAWPTSLSSAATPAEEQGGLRGHKPGEYDQRGKEWVAKIDQPDDVRAAIEGIANDHDWFPEARGGVASPAARKAVAEAAGIDPAGLDGDYFAQHFDSDGKVRAVIQALRQTAKDVSEAADLNVKTPSVENAATLAEAQLRHTHVLEYTMGLRAESGRTLAAWKDLLREQEHTKATTEIRKKETTGEAPRGTAGVVDAVKDVQDNLKAVAKGESKPGTKIGIDKLIDQAKNLLDSEGEGKKPVTPLKPEVKALVDEARNALKQFDVKENVGLDKLIDQAKGLIDAADEEVKKTGTPLSPELKSLVDEARNALKEPKKTGLEKLIEQAKKFDEAEAKKEAAPVSPEIKELTDAAKNVLKRFGADKDANLDAFRGELDRLSTGDGKLDSAVNAARDLIKAHEKPPKTGEPKSPTDRAQLTAAAKRLVAAADKAAPEAKTPMPAKTRSLMEAARQAVGRLKTAGNEDMAAFRQALADGDAKAAKAAAQRLVDAEAKVEPGQAKPPVEYETVMAEARKLAKAGTEATAKEKATLLPDIKALVDQANDAAKEFGVQQKSVLDSLVDQAEREAVNMTKSKAVNDPVEALPPELQALVDKAKRVTDRFGGTARAEKAQMLLARAGKPVDVSGLTPNQAARVLAGVRRFEESGNKSTAQPWYYWIRNQGLISGVITHTKYAIVNTSMVAMERWASPTLGAVIGKARGQDVSVMAPTRGMVSMFSQIPDAGRAAWDAAKRNQRMPIASELRLFERGEESPQTKGAINPYDQNSGPEWGIWKRVFNETQLDTAAQVLGIPGRSANALHTFFKVLSERAALSTAAYEAAHKEGVTGDRFAQRWQYHLDNPTDDVLRGAVNDAYSGAFMSKLEGGWEKVANSVGNFPILGPVFFPFRHIPVNIARKGIEYSPLLSVLDKEFRSALMGEKGAPAQNLAIAKNVVGASIIGFFMMKSYAEEMTGPYPTNPDERREWQLTNKQPFSLKMGDQWVAMERLGPLGMVANTAAVLGVATRHYVKQDRRDDVTLGSAMMAASMGAAGVLGNEAGFQSLRDVSDAINGDENKLGKILSNQAGSVVPSLLSQSASWKDPYQRKAEGLVAALQYRVPGLRDSLPVKRDPLYGEPLPNPGYHALFRSSQISMDPVRADLDRLKIYPTQPQNNLGDKTPLKLPPNLYDKYQELHGQFTHLMLDPIVNQPGWLNVPAPQRAETIQKIRPAITEAAKGQMKAMYPEIIVQGMKDTVSTITGAKKTKLQDVVTP